MKFPHIVILLILVILGLGIKNWYFKPKFEFGELAPNFEATTANGNTFALKMVRGKYVVIDFWGSWCGPCRAENPSWVKLNRDFQDKKFGDATGFEIISIGIEANRASWLKAIQEDKLDWPIHIGQFERFKSPLAIKYGVREIPTNYFINPDGLILGVNQSADEIAQFLTSKVK